MLAALALDRKAMERLDDDEKGVSSIHTPGGLQQVSTVNESGLYSLILGSRKPEAKPFKRWVTGGEVLPTIRKTGRYETASAGPALPDFTDPATAAIAWAEPLRGISRCAAPSCRYTDCARDRRSRPTGIMPRTVDPFLV